MGHEGKDSMAGAGLFIAIGLVAMGFLLKSAIVTFKESERVVYVKGLAEKEVPADQVIWPLVFKEVGDDLPTLYEAIETKNQAILAFLKSNGIEESEITFSAPAIIDMKAERYANENVPYRYNVTSVLTVSSTKVAVVRQLMLRQKDLLKQGIAISGGDFQYTTQFNFTKLNDVKPGMIAEATSNARLSAEKFAKDSESDLGKIKSATQGQFSISDRDANTPYIKTVRVVTTIEYYLKD